nr:hypothetical protein Iba_chr14bCG10250 [Ipomoea batatas]
MGAQKVLPISELVKIYPYKQEPGEKEPFIPVKAIQYGQSEIEILVPQLEITGCDLGYMPGNWPTEVGPIITPSLTSLSFQGHSFQSSVELDSRGFAGYLISDNIPCKLPFRNEGLLHWRHLRSSNLHQETSSKYFDRIASEIVTGNYLGSFGPDLSSSISYLIRDHFLSPGGSYLIFFAPCMARVAAEFTIALNVPVTSTPECAFREPSRLKGFNTNAFILFAALLLFFLVDSVPSESCETQVRTESRAPKVIHFQTSLNPKRLSRSNN